jgi:hypothetical protein
MPGSAGYDVVIERYQNGSLEANSEPAYASRQPRANGLAELSLGPQ